MATSFNDKLKKKKKLALDPGRIVSLANPEVIKKKSKWQKVDVSRVVNRNFPTMGITSFEELDPEEFFNSNKNKPSSDAPSKRKAEEIETVNVAAQPKPRKQKKPKRGRKPLPEIDASSIKLPEWEHLMLNPLLLKALQDREFSRPTPIQNACIPQAIINHKDIVGAAATGSGKTLAFGLPILHKLLEKLGTTTEYIGISALIITPTRELAMQIVEHLKAAAKYTNINIIGLVGGLSSVKQERTLNSNPDIVVATPGRLWELMESATPDSILYDMSMLSFLVIDEADRMIETGHFKELEYILQSLATFRDLKVIESKPQEQLIEETIEEQEKKKRTKLLRMIPEGEEEEEENQEDMEEPMDEEDVNYLLQHADDPEIDDYEEIPDEEELRQQYIQDESQHEEDEDETKKKVQKKGPQTFVFSATLTTTHTKIITQKKRVGAKIEKTKQGKEVSHLDKLFEMIQFYHKVEIIDLTSKETVNSSITQAKVLCTEEDKDLYLYAFLSQHPGRTLLFVNAIATTKRLQPLFKLLDIPIYSLHAEMQQKQRLKSLERFKSNPNAVLIATDVAARGLDIPSVSHVIHYHIPNTFETYVHRSGRTARAGNTGVALAFVTAQDGQKYKKMCQGMKIPDLPDYPFDGTLMPALTKRLELASTIENMEHRVQKEKANKSWMQKAAEDCDIILDEKIDEDADWRKKQAKLKLEALQHELKALLKTPLMPKGNAKKYLQMTNKIGTFINTQNKKNAIEQIESQKNKKPKKLRFKPK